MEGFEELSAALFRQLVPVAAALVTRPALWPTATRQIFRLAGSGWWRRPPFLPLPDRRYLHFRMITMYGGDGSAKLGVTDAIAYLEWCRDWPTA